MRTSAPPILVLYDDHCPMCTFQSRLLEWADWLRAIRLMPVSSAAATKAAPQLTRQDLLAAIHCIERDGRIYRGARALRHLGGRLPLLAPLATLLWVPGVIHIAECVYGWVARHRHALSRVLGCAGACQMLPPRAQDKKDAE